MVITQSGIHPVWYIVGVVTVIFIIFAVFIWLEIESPRGQPST